MPRVGKVKIFTEEGKLIREGIAREDDFSHKLLGLFEPGELVKGGIIFISIIFGAGVLWAKIDGSEKIEKDIWASIAQNKNQIQCVQNQLKGCCRESEYCS